MTIPTPTTARKRCARWNAFYGSLADLGRLCPACAATPAPTPRNPGPVPSHHTKVPRLWRAVRRKHRPLRQVVRPMQNLTSLESSLRAVGLDPCHHPGTEREMRTTDHAAQSWASPRPVPQSCPLVTGVSRPGGRSRPPSRPAPPVRALWASPAAGPVLGAGQ
jgi:hypothetical protein